MDDNKKYNFSAGADQSGVTGFDSSSGGTGSATREFSAPGAGNGSTGFEDSQTGHGDTGFEQTGGRGDGAGSGEMTSDPNASVTGFSKNSEGPGSHGAAFEAPGTGTQKTGFSNVESGYTGFEGDSSGATGGMGESHGTNSGSGGSSSGGGGGGLKEKLAELKDKIKS